MAMAYTIQTVSVHYRMPCLLSHILGYTMKNPQIQTAVKKFGHPGKFYSSLEFFNDIISVLSINLIYVYGKKTFDIELQTKSNQISS